jgi:hypothetical protein
MITFRSEWRRPAALAARYGRVPATRATNGEVSRLFLVACESSCAMRFHVWFALSLIMATTSIISVFVFIPLVSAYAFWFVVAAYIFLASSHRRWF